MKTAIVTGGNRGIGLEVCRQLAAEGFRVVLTARNVEKGQAAADSLGDNVVFERLDVSSEEDIERFASVVEEKYNGFDVLVNNAGIMIDPWGEPQEELYKSRTETILKTFRTNTLGPFVLCQKLLPLMSDGGRVVNVSSGMGQLRDMGNGFPGYRLSKLALNGVTRIFSTSEPRLFVNSMCPGWVKTDMGGSNAQRPVEKGAETIVWLATTNEEYSGKFFRDKQVIAW